MGLDYSVRSDRIHRPIWSGGGHFGWGFITPESPSPGTTDASFGILVQYGVPANTVRSSERRVVTHSRHQRHLHFHGRKEDGSPVLRCKCNNRHCLGTDFQDRRALQPTNAKVND